MYKKIYEVGNKRQTGRENTHLIHLWTDEGYEKIEWDNYAYKECPEDEAKFIGLNGESLLRTNNWDRNTNKLHCGDISAHQKFLIEKYGIDDRPSTTCKEVFCEIECEMGGALTEEYISNAPKPITSIAWYDKQADQWAIVILDKKGQLKRTKAKNKEIIPFRHEADLLDCLERDFFGATSIPISFLNKSKALEARSASSALLYTQSWIDFGCSLAQP